MKKNNINLALAAALALSFGQAWAESPVRETASSSG